MTSETPNRAPDTVSHGLRSFWNPGFVLCGVLLLAMAVGFKAWAERNKITLGAKLRVDLQQPLDRIDKHRIAPYKLVRHFTIESAMLGALGTDQYIHWLLENADVKDRAAPERYVTLFVTYYTGQPDPVPHVPEVCYVGGGYKPERIRSEEFSIPLDGKTETVPVKVLRFERSGYSETQKMVVLYTFSANGQFSASRNGVRTIVGDAGTQYAYYSKVEATFGTPDSRPTEEVAVEAGRKLFAKIIPILVEDCWPDWDHEAKAPVMAGAAEGDEIARGGTRSTE
jgi:hypothetical protein